jgi:hypothetical protein
VKLLGISATAYRKDRINELETNRMHRKTHRLA